ncbi:MAG: HpcH/HpaI aldolase/citrate lyase family protein [Eubacterium sp.]|nr:HpcH/HpaI aldolase/citrate lyase family protein [Eubacterium sp.]
MKNSSIYYSVGPLLYCPANRETIAPSLIGQKFGDSFSLALCLEDTIGDSHVEEAERCLANSIRQIRCALEHTSFYLPKIFIRVRCPQQIMRMVRLLGDSQELLSGFIIPKFSPENADAYIQQMITANEFLARRLYLMPIYESVCIIDLRSRFDVLYTLKEKLSRVEELVLNIRVGGNDLCHLFSFRRHAWESIHRIRPIADIFSAIMAVYGMDYVVSGAVWEYYSGYGWREGLINELADDRLCGLIGKTVIHPNQIDVVNDACRVTQKDYDDARSILHWDSDSAYAVSASPARERMNEHKTHTNWARQTLYLAERYGIKPCQERIAR